MQVPVSSHTDTGTPDFTQLRADFPILQQEVHGHPLVYLDNAATGQKPRQVIETVDKYYREINSNVHRGIHHLSDLATRAYEGTRKKAQQWLNAAHEHEIIFTKGTTDGINLVAASFGKKYFEEGDEVIVSAMEHHSNIVPWQLWADAKNVKLRVIPMNDDADLLLDEYEKLFSDKTKIVSIVHTSNSLGTVNPVAEIIRIAHAKGVPVLVDGAQAVPHAPVDVQALDCDFFVCSAHKFFGPTGAGILYGKEKWLNDLPPYQGGGDMIRDVSFEKTTWNDLPYKFEAGTPNIAGVIGMGAAIDYINAVGYDWIGRHEHDLLTYTTGRMLEIEGMRIVGTAKKKASVISFVVEGTHPSDIGTLLDVEGVAIRTGHHCTQPVMQRYNLPATARASFAFYNSREDADRFLHALEKALRMLR